MGRLGKVLLVLAIVAVALGGGAVLGLRAGRSKVGTPTEIKPGLFAVTNAGGIYAFAARVAPGPHVILFDTGMDPEGRPVDALLQALRASRDDVSDVFLTHGHFDHTAGAPLLGKAKVHLGSPDVGLATGQMAPEGLVGRLLTKAMSPPPVTINTPITAAGAIPVSEPEPAAAAKDTAPKEAADAPPKDGDAAAKEADGAAKTVKAYAVPGHSPGSYAFLYDGVLFAGDIMIFKQGRLDPTPRVFDPNPDANKAAIKSLKTQLAGEKIDRVCTAHGDGCTPKGLGRNLLDELIDRV